MKTHVKNLKDFIAEYQTTFNPSAAANIVVGTVQGAGKVPTTSTGAESEGSIIPLTQQDPVLQYGTWSQTATGVQPNGAYPDILLAQAALHGMSPAEYLAHYGHSTEGQDK